MNIISWYKRQSDVKKAYISGVPVAIIGTFLIYLVAYFISVLF